MNRRTKIDDLFREKVTRKEEAPPNDVWEKIDARISQDQRQKRLLIPLWYKIVGVAAVLVLIFTLTRNTDQPSFSSPSVTNQPVKTKPGKSENYFEERVPDVPVDSGPKSSESSGTAVAKNDPKAEGSSDKDMTPTTTSPTTIGRPRVETLKIVFTAGKRTVSGIQPSGTILDLKIPETLRVAIEESGKENIIDTEDPAKEAFPKGSFEDNFSISPTIAAVYFGKIGEGNALDQKFAGNSNPGEISVAYGLSLAYQISGKVKIRSGVNNISLSSKTQNVENNLAGNASAVEGNPAGNIHFSDGYGTLAQQLNFLEIPLELEYALIDRQVGVSLIAGASTFFLQENEVTLSSADFSGSLGPANNLNKTSFSANLGIGFKYHLFSHFEFNLNPMFKYQVNTYDGVSDLKPYHFGIYTGIRFKF